MSGTTTKDALPYPTLTDTRDVPRDILALANALDGRGVYSCTSATRPTSGARFSGRVIWETDTKAYGWWDGSAWRMFDTIEQTYTPTWTANGSTSGLALGTGGSLTGTYMRRGHHCRVDISLVVGSSGFAGGAGYWAFAAPFAATSTCKTLVTETWSPAAGGNFVGHAVILNGASTIAPQVSYSSSNTVMWQLRNADVGGVAGTGIPNAAGVYTWTTSGGVDIGGEYRI